MIRANRVSFNDRKDLLFVGNFVHPPNSDALIQYCSRILPLLRKKLPNIKTYIVGANSLPLLEDFANDDVIITGFIPDLKHFWIDAYSLWLHSIYELD